MWKTAGIADTAGMQRAEPYGPGRSDGRGGRGARPPRGGCSAASASSPLIALTDLAPRVGARSSTGCSPRRRSSPRCSPGARRTAIVGAVSIAVNVRDGQLRRRTTRARRASAPPGWSWPPIGAVGLSMLRQREQRHLLTVSRIAEVAQLAVLRNLPPRIGPAAGRRALRVGDRAGPRGRRLLRGAPLPGRACGRSSATCGARASRRCSSPTCSSARSGAPTTTRSALAELARTLDQAFLRFEPGDEDFATVVMVELRDDGGLTVVNCGHPPPLVVTRGGLAPIRAAGLRAAGRARTRDPRPTELRLEPGDRLLLFTDGILESRHAGRFFDFDANAPVVAEGPPRPGPRRPRATGWSPSPAARVGDDVALLLAEYP